MIGNPYKGRGFKGLLQYLHYGRKGEENPHRVVWSEAGNLPTTDPMVVAGIMRATTSLSRGTKTPVYHLPISWPPEEQPPKEIQMQVAETLIADLGLSEHQYLIVAHDDGDCSHIHVVLNTVHPETGRVWNGWNDMYRVMESLGRQERELGFRIVDRPDLEEFRTGKKDPDRKKNPSHGELKRAEREGDEALSKWSETMMRRVRGNITNHFKEATSWGELAARLKKQDLKLVRAGQGFRITDGKHFMTLSKVGKHARQDRLENRFQETWEDYEIDRDVASGLLDQLEPRNSERPESILEELENRADRQKAEANIETDGDVKRALLASSKYAYFRNQEAQATEAAALHVTNCRAARRVQWTKEKIVKDMGHANAAFEEACSQLYRNPRTAWAEMDRRMKAGESFDEIDFDTVGKKRGWKFLGFRSQGRKHANNALKGLPRANQRLANLRNQWDIQEYNELELYGKLGASEASYNEAVAKIGGKAQRKKRGMALWKERHNALNKVTEKDIWRSDLKEDELEQLAGAWEENIESQRGKESRKLRNATVRDFYEGLYEESREVDIVPER